MNARKYPQSPRVSPHTPEIAKSRMLRACASGAQCTPRVKSRIKLKKHRARVMRVRFSVKAPMRRAARVNRIVPNAQQVAVPTAAASPRTKRDPFFSGLNLFQKRPQLRIAGPLLDPSLQRVDRLFALPRLKQCASESVVTESRQRVGIGAEGKGSNGFREHPFGQPFARELVPLPHGSGAAQLMELIYHLRGIA